MGSWEGFFAGEDARPRGLCFIDHYDLITGQVTVRQARLHLINGFKLPSSTRLKQREPLALRC